MLVILSEQATPGYLSYAIKMQLYGIYLINSEVDTFLAILISVKDIFTNLHKNIFEAFPILAKLPNLTSKKRRYV